VDGRVLAGDALNAIASARHERHTRIASKQFIDERETET
jgi:hypothetical protein